MSQHKLVIAEKPSVAQSIAAILGATTRRDGYMEGNGYLVSWCFGHLAELASAEVYDEKYAKWRYDDLPIIPSSWRMTLGKDKGKQYDLLHDLMRRDDVAEVIDACDAGREGELIFRTVYYMAGCTKTMKRLWISSMEDEAIRKGFADLKPGREYDGLHQAALCRARADWLVGINATRLFSVLYHRTLNVGRVMTPTLALLVQREAEIGAFKPEPFYTVNLCYNGFDAASEKYKDKTEADTIAAACKGQAASVTSVERKEKTEKAPALYDLTTLQRDANRLLGYTAQQTLDYLQALYEKKLCTYPRTDARYLTDDMESTIPSLVAVAAAICEADAPVSVNAAQICNSKKVSDHHAVVPTASASKADTSVLPIGEREILRLVARQLLCAVSDAHKYAETAVTIECGGYSFTAKGKTILTPGWKAYIQSEQPDKALPDMTEGDTTPVTDVTVKEGKTTPPKHFTEDTLLSAMETAGAKETPDDAERKGLGTPATRAAILEKLVSTGFVERKKAKKTVNLMPARTGVSLITVLPEQLQSPLLTAEWEYRLKQVERGELSPEDFMGEITDMLTELVKTYQVIAGAEVLFPSGREVVGKCPRCGGDVSESKKGFFCEHNDCRFGLWRDNKFFSAKKIALTKKTAAALLKDGRAALTGLYSEKTGKTYDATVVMEDTGESVRFHLEFGKEART
ncbi:MAG: DNA topoisomerase 3 [Oscillospiraceae bacterium]|nr:DNA topoisomerase 3 [Oscillospiraceae bacterium]